MPLRVGESKKQKCVAMPTCVFDESSGKCSTGPSKQLSTFLGSWCVAISVPLCIINQFSLWVHNTGLSLPGADGVQFPGSSREHSGGSVFWHFLRLLVPSLVSLFHSFGFFSAREESRLLGYRMSWNSRMFWKGDLPHRSFWGRVSWPERGRVFLLFVSQRTNDVWTSTHSLQT